MGEDVRQRIVVTGPEKEVDVFQAWIRQNLHFMSDDPPSGFDAEGFGWQRLDPTTLRVVSYDRNHSATEEVTRFSTTLPNTVIVVEVDTLNYGASPRVICRGRCHGLYTRHYTATPEYVEDDDCSDFWIPDPAGRWRMLAEERERFRSEYVRHEVERGRIEVQRWMRERDLKEAEKVAKEP